MYLVKLWDLYVKNYRTALVVYVPRRAARIKITILQYFIVIKLRLQLQILARGAPFGGFSPVRRPPAADQITLLAGIGQNRPPLNLRPAQY